MSKHTPGEWMLPHFADPESKCDCGYVLSPDYMGCIAEVKYSVDGDQADNPPRPEAQANARLIAAAPDLLEAVEATKRAGNAGNENRHADWNSVWRLVDKALAKARGES